MRGAIPVKIKKREVLAELYPHRLNFYSTPPTAEISLEQFEQWAIHRLRILGEIESSQFRNKTPKEIEVTLEPLLKKYLPLSASSYAKLSSKNLETVQLERKKDHYSHFILRLAFARSPDLRSRFSRLESFLFRLRFSTDDAKERDAFINSLNLDWDPVPEDEKLLYTEQLSAASGARIFDSTDSIFKVPWEKVPDLVEARRVFLRHGKAYVPSALQLSLVSAEFTSQLDRALELTARALPRLDEDERLVPILNHLSLGFTAPEFVSSTDTTSLLNGAPVTAASVDSLVSHFPLCMSHLHTTLRRNKHLLHHSRYQYNLFLKGIGLSVDEALNFWRSAFSNITDDEFNKKYRYNVRHAYGLEGNRRSYKPLSCQQILTEHSPSGNQTHGCPYRHFSIDNLIAALAGPLGGIQDRDVLQGVRNDVDQKRYHIACNRVFDHLHAKELKREKDEGRSGAGQRETIIHPNQYFTLSWELKHPKARKWFKGTK
ncbi:eukaryotic and archaeal DNA primase, large subunit-domain-containing protein [Kalaharituber pfeilii]|nr:eukaryotic and archaeal DNA primase, large subunit-domain-containing protein [Kalaharituber pfeilii]